MGVFKRWYLLPHLILLVTYQLTLGHCRTFLGSLLHFSGTGKILLLIPTYYLAEVTPPSGHNPTMAVTSRGRGSSGSSPIIFVSIWEETQNIQWRNNRKTVTEHRTQTDQSTISTGTIDHTISLPPTPFPTMITIPLLRVADSGNVMP